MVYEDALASVRFLSPLLLGPPPLPIPALPSAPLHLKVRGPACGPGGCSELYHERLSIYHQRLSIRCCSWAAVLAAVTQLIFQHAASSSSRLRLAEEFCGVGGLDPA
jgi:hypothetical protein